MAHDYDHFLSVGPAPCSNDRKFIHTAASVLHGLVGRLSSDGLLSRLSDLRRKTTFEPHPHVHVRWERLTSGRRY